MLKFILVFISAIILVCAIQGYVIGSISGQSRFIVIGTCGVILVLANMKIKE